MTAEKESLIRKQIEYYFSDKNLKQDMFFHNKISQDKEGWVDISFIMNCNKIKELTTDQEEIEASIKESTEVEFDKGKNKFYIICVYTHFLCKSEVIIGLGGIRRIGNKSLPPLEIKKKEEVKEEIVEDGVITQKDFKNPTIIKFKTEAKEGSEDPSWRDLEKDVAEKFSTIKILYSRMKDFVGQIAISSQNPDQKAIDSLLKETITSAGYDYTFEMPSEDELKAFWEEHGSHYEMCQKQKMRKLK